MDFPLLFFLKMCENCCRNMPVHDILKINSRIDKNTMWEWEMPRI